VSTLTISRNSLFLRLFLWVWEANPEKLNVCKLFWGTLFFPVAFLQFKRIYRFIPRITIFYMLGAVLLAALGLWISAIIWSFGGVIFAIGGYVAMWRSQGADDRRKEKEQALSKITGRVSVVVDWILDHTLGLVFDFADDVSCSMAGRRIGGFFGVIGEYIHATKQRLCPLIRVV